MGVGTGDSNELPSSMISSTRALLVFLSLTLSRTWQVLIIKLSITGHQACCLFFLLVTVQKSKESTNDSEHNITYDSHTSDRQLCSNTMFHTWLYVVLCLWQRPHWNRSDWVPELSTIWWSLNASRDNLSRIFFISSLAISSGVMIARCGMEIWQRRTFSRSRGFFGS